MTEHANVTLTRLSYAAFATGDIETLRNLMTENSTWHQPGKGSIAGDYVGRERVFEYFGKLVELTGGTFKAEPVEIFAGDDRAVVIQHSTGTRDGKVLDTRDVLVFEIHDGKFAETQVYPSDPQQEDSFWS